MHFIFSYFTGLTRSYIYIMDCRKWRWTLFKILWNLNVFGWTCSHLEVQFFSLQIFFFLFFSCNHFLRSNHCLCRGTAPKKTHTHISPTRTACTTLVHISKGHMALTALFFFLFHIHINRRPRFLRGHAVKHMLTFGDIIFHTSSVLVRIKIIKVHFEEKLGIICRKPEVERICLETRLAVVSQGGNAFWEDVVPERKHSLSPPPNGGKVDPSTWGNSG